MNKTLTVLLTVGTVLSYFCLANSFVSYSAYGQQQGAYETLVPDASIVTQRGEGQTTTDLGDDGLELLMREHEYCSEKLLEVHKLFLDSIEHSKRRALHEGIAWVLLALILTSSLIIVELRDKRP